MVNVTEQFERFIELRNITVKSNGRVILNIEHAIIPADRITCLLYTSPSPRDRTRSRMPSSA